nr:hypothetical protein [Tanacetum cinerariifolium]
MNYKPVVAGNKSNGSAGKARVETVPNKDYILLPLWTQDPLLSSSSKDSPGDGFKPSGEEEKKNVENLRNEDNELLSTVEPRVSQDKDSNVNSTNNINIVSPTANMDVKSAFLYGKIKEEVYVCQPLGFEDPEFSDRVYKVEKALYSLHQAPRAWYETLSTYLLDNRFHRCQIDKTLFIKRVKELQVTQKDDGIFICQDKYVDEILKKFGFSTVKTTSTPMETSKPLMKDENAKDVDVHLYRSMIGSLMYLTSSRPDIIYLKGQPKLGLWYPKGSPFDLEAYTNSNYDGAGLDRKATTGGCQFIGRRLISWQFKKQTVIANSTIC